MVIEQVALYLSFKFYVSKLGGGRGGPLCWQLWHKKVWVENTDFISECSLMWGVHKSFEDPMHRSRDMSKLINSKLRFFVHHLWKVELWLLYSGFDEIHRTVLVIVSSWSISTFLNRWRRSESEILSFSLFFLTLQPASLMSAMMN